MLITPSAQPAKTATRLAPTAASATPSTRVSPPPDNWRDEIVQVSPLRTALSAGAGALALGGLATLVSGSPVAGIVGGLAGAVAGGWLGRNGAIMAYDRGIRNRDNANYRITEQFRDRHHAQKSDSLPVLTRQNLRALDRVGDVERRYDAWDSGRDLFAVSTREGEPQQPYSFQVEMAHLREGAEFQGGLKLTVAPATEGAAALTVEVRDGKAYRSEAGQKVEMPGAVSYDPKFSHVRVDLGKDLLRALGWKDGDPLKVDVTSTASDGQKVDALQALTAAQLSSGELTSGLYRWEGQTVYYAITDRFHNGDKTNDAGVRPDHPEGFHGGDYQGVISKLDYLKDMGVDCIWLSCPYENDRDFLGNDGYHGYWPQDFNKAEPSFGSKEKLRELTEKAHALGIKVMLDVVLNHTGYKHPFTEDRDKANWFHQHGKIRSDSQWATENQSLAGLPDLAVEREDVSSHLIEAHKAWLKDTGVDAFRLDAVRHIPRGFTREFVESMKAEKPDFFSVGEVFWRDSNYVAAYQRETQESMFDFPLAYAIRSVFSGDPNRSKEERLALADEVEKHNNTESDRLRWSNGDESMKMLSKALEADALYDNPKKLMTFVDNHDMMRFMSDCGGDVTRLQNALGFLYACRGIPSLYYGTESAMEGWGPENRKDMEWGANPEVHQAITRLTHARKGSAALQYGTQKELMVTDDSYALARIRTDEQVVAVFNNAREERTMTVPLDSAVPAGATFDNMLAEGTVRAVDGHLVVTLPPRSFAYYSWKAETV